MDGRRGFELMELLAVKLLLAAVWLAVRGGHELATASMLDQGFAAIRDVDAGGGDRNRSAPMLSMGPPLPPWWPESVDPEFGLDHDRVRRDSGPPVPESSAAPIRAMVGTFPLHGN